MFSWFQTVPFTLSSAGASLWLLFVFRVLLEPWAGGGCGVVPRPAHCTPFLQEYFGVSCLLTLLEIGFVGSELPWRIPATGGGFIIAGLRSGEISGRAG